VRTVAQENGFKIVEAVKSAASAVTKKLNKHRGAAPRQRR
jgi:hypothetical protein